MASIRWTAEAEQWLHDIFLYISADNPAAARSVIQGIHEKVRTLRLFPKIGYVHRVEAEGEIRILPYGHYRIAYLTKTTGELDILGIFHGALNIERYMP